MVRRNPRAASIWVSFSRPFPTVYFSIHFGYTLAHFGILLATFGSLLLHFRSLLMTIVSLAFPWAHFCSPWRSTFSLFGAPGANSNICLYFRWKAYAKSYFFEYVHWKSDCWPLGTLTVAPQLSAQALNDLEDIPQGHLLRALGYRPTHKRPEESTLYPSPALCAYPQHLRANLGCPEVIALLNPL
jgi:hypothetical protein